MLILIDTLVITTVTTETVSHTSYMYRELTRIDSPINNIRAETVNNIRAYCRNYISVMDRILFQNYVCLMYLTLRAK